MFQKKQNVFNRHWEGMRLHIFCCGFQGSLSTNKHTTTATFEGKKTKKKCVCKVATTTLQQLTVAITDLQKALKDYFTKEAKALNEQVAKFLGYFKGKGVFKEILEPEKVKTLMKKNCKYLPYSKVTSPLK
jgi:hypothetical protein